MATISLDGRTALVQYADLVLRLRDFLDKCVDADAQAAQALAGQPLLNAVTLAAERRYWSAQAGARKCPRTWTLRDVKRLDGHDGACRTAIALNWFRSGDAEPRHERLFREAIEEARRDGTAAVVAPALNELRQAFDRLLRESRLIAQGEGDRREFKAAVLGVHRAVDPVKQFTRPGTGDKGSGTIVPSVGVNTQIGPLPEVDLKLCQVRWNGKCHPVTADQALLVSAAVEAYPEWFAADKLSSKPSALKKELPSELKALLESKAGKGYRLKLP